MTAFRLLLHQETLREGTLFMATTNEVMIQEGSEVRTATADELAQFTKDAAEAKIKAQANAARQALKTATLAKLGLTADEVAALLS
jgi:hypothetical protein